jgi:hypothetical protein
MHWASIAGKENVVYRTQCGHKGDPKPEYDSKSAPETVLHCGAMNI